jgi:3-dehydroquinate synthase
MALKHIEYSGSRIEMGDLTDGLHELMQIEADQFVVITDRNVASYWRAKWLQLWPVRQPTFIIIPAGESSKSLVVAQRVWKKMQQLQLSRKSIVIALGGGVVGDLAGWCAANYMRGIRWVQVPTTLLAMTDSSVGGKTGINLGGTKNSIGSFHFPELVLIHPEFLTTLPPRQWLAGKAEMLKHGLIGDLSLWDALIADDIFESSRFDSELFLASLNVKIRVCEQDPYEKGLRKTLNFGHTAGHAIESLSLSESPDSALLHGEAIAQGMAIALDLSVKKAGLDVGFAQKAIAQLRLRYPFMSFDTAQQRQLWLSMGRDKKNIGDQVLFCLLEAPAKPIWDQTVIAEDLFGIW